MNWIAEHREPERPRSMREADRATRQPTTRAGCSASVEGRAADPQRRSAAATVRVIGRTSDEEESVRRRDAGTAGPSSSRFPTVAIAGRPSGRGSATRRSCATSSTGGPRSARCYPVAAADVRGVRRGLARPLPPARQAGDSGELRRLAQASQPLRVGRARGDQGRRGRGSRLRRRRRRATGRPS